MQNNKEQPGRENRLFLSPCMCAGSFEYRGIIQYLSALCKRIFWNKQKIKTNKSKQTKAEEWNVNALKHGMNFVTMPTPLYALSRTHYALPFRVSNYLKAGTYATMFAFKTSIASSLSLLLLLSFSAQFLVVLVCRFSLVIRKCVCFLWLDSSVLYFLGYKSKIEIGNKLADTFFDK